MGKDPESSAFWHDELQKPSKAVAKILTSAQHVGDAVEFRVLFVRDKATPTTRWIDAVRALPIGQHPRRKASRQVISIQCRTSDGRARSPEQMALVGGSDEVILTARYNKLPGAWSLSISWLDLGVSSHVFEYS